MSETEEIINDLQTSNVRYAAENASILPKHISGQKPNVAVLTCSDSRVIPEYIFQREIGDIFTVRVAGNIAIDSCVLASLEYAVTHLKIKLLIILGHTHCGAVAAAEKTQESWGFLDEIRHSFTKDENHSLANIKYQLEMIPKRSKIISKAIKKEELRLIGAIYNLENGLVEFL